MYVPVITLGEDVDGVEVPLGLDVLELELVVLEPLELAVLGLDVLELELVVLELVVLELAALDEDAPELGDTPASDGAT